MQASNTTAIPTHTAAERPFFLGGEHIATDDRFESERQFLQLSGPHTAMELPGGYWAAVSSPKKRSPVQEVFAKVGRLGDEAPLAYVRFDLVEFRSESSVSGVLNHLYEDGADGFANLLIEMFDGDFLGASQALGPISNFYELQFRPSAALDGATKLQIVKGFMDQLHTHFGVGLHLIATHGCAAAPKLLGHIGGVVLAEGRTGYTSLDAAAMAKLGSIGECLLIDEGFGSGAEAQSA